MILCILLIRSVGILKTDRREHNLILCKRDTMTAISAHTVKQREQKHTAKSHVNNVARLNQGLELNPDSISCVWGNSTRADRVDLWGDVRV